MNDKIEKKIENKNKVKDFKDNYYIIDSLSMDFNSDQWDHIRISIADRNYILGISKGEVTKTDTLNYRTLKPEKHGIFCPSIFGPTDDFKCECRRYIGEAYKGLRCERCNVMVGSRKLRRLNFGHIKLSTVVIHPWFYPYVCSLLKITKKVFSSIINFDSFIFIKNSSNNEFKQNKIITSSEYYSDLFIHDELMSGSEAILELLKQIDVKTELQKIFDYTKGKKSSDVTDREIRRRDILIKFIESNTKPEDLAISILPCLPADLRPIFYLEGGGIATMDINDLYRKTISRNNRLKKLNDLETHKIIINNEKFMINQVVVQLMGPQKSTINKSIAEYLKGKMGYIRRASLGKRGDYTGRGAISVGPNLLMWECSIPIAIILELFKPFLYSIMLRRKIAYSLIEAKRKVEIRSIEIFSLLKELVEDFPIILNRAPTLHRLGIQGFKIKLTNSNAIRISPLVCTGYNADFDGDQMSVHLPISIAARVECYSLMLSSNNLFLPSNGRLILSPSKDIVVGLYYLSCISDNLSFENIYISNRSELFHLIEFKYLNENMLFKYLIKDINNSKVFKTTYGRILLWECVQEENRYKIDFNLFNLYQDKNSINNMIMHIFHNIGWDETLNFLNNITKIGFYKITESGLSYTIDDMIEPLDKKECIEKIEENIKQIHEHYINGLITYEELDTSIISEWSKYINKSGDDIIDLLQKDKRNCNDNNQVNGNNIYLMYISGARGSKSQIQQVCCLRGFMAKPSGEISKLVISSSLRCGLNIFEYFESTHGERKGLSDVAIKTSKAGHFTRRLVDVAHSIYINCKDCETNDCIEINKILDKRKFGLNFYDAIFGKCLAKDLFISKKIIFKRNEIIDLKIYNTIIQHDINTVFVRSPIYCLLDDGICQMCYGMDLSVYKMVDEGTTVGIIAAQSIGEPGTQLTMRTTHTGGIAKTEDHETTIVSESDGILDMSQVIYSVNTKGDSIVLRDSKILIHKQSKQVLEEIDIKSASILLKKDNDVIKSGEIIAYYNNSLRLIMAMQDGIISHKDLIEDISYMINMDNETGIVRKQIISNNRLYDEKISPSILITDISGKIYEYTLEPGMFIIAHENQIVKKGDTLTKFFSYTVKTHDITGGLPRIIDLFEAKKNVNKALVTSHEGLIKITHGKGLKKSKQVSIIDVQTNKILNKFIIPNSKHLLVQDGLHVRKGVVIMDGEIYIQDIMDSMGFDYSIKHLIGEISIIYEDQGVNISHKHFEVIIKQITKFCIIIFTGDSDLLLSKVYNIKIAEEVNKKLISENKNPCIYRRMIFGITRVALDYYNSFISSSSFQHTISILSKAAIEQSIDKMKGIKENVIFGKKIPVGTGYHKFVIN